MRKILVIRFSSLGDVVLTLPVFKRLRQTYPHAHITALVKERFADVLREEPSISQVMTLKSGERLLTLCRKIRAERFEGVLDLHANLRSRLVTAFSGARRVVRYQKASLARRLFVRWRVDRPQLKAHTVDRYMDAIHRLIQDSRVTLTSAPQNILVIQTAFLGDAVLTTPLVNALVDQFPQSRLTILCTPEVKDVFASRNGITEILIFDKRGRERSWAARWRLVRSLRARAYDLAIIPHRSVTSALLAYLSGIPRRVGFSASQAKVLLTDIIPFHWGVHDVERNLALLQAFGVENPSRDLWLKPEPEIVERVSRKLQDQGVKPLDTLVGMNVGSVWATKRWVPEGFAAVADRLAQEKGVKVLLIGGAKDQGPVQDVVSRMKTRPLNWVGETQLKELIALISRCQAFLTNDSGPMHIAVATRVPTVALFGPTTKELGFFPYGTGHRVIEKNLSCRPCSLHGENTCPLGHFDCMKTISPDEVYQAVLEQLSAGPRSAAVESR